MAMNIIERLRRLFHRHSYSPRPALQPWIKDKSTPQQKVIDMTSLEKIIGIIVAAIALIKKLDGDKSGLQAELDATKKEFADFKDKTATEEAVLNKHIDDLEAALSAIAPVGSTGGIGG